MAAYLELSELIAKHVNGVIVENRELIAQSIREGLSSQMSDADVLARVSINAVNIATRLSVQSTLAILTEIGVIKSAGTAPPDLQVLLGGTPEEQPPPEP